MGTTPLQNSYFRSSVVGTSGTITSIRKYQIIKVNRHASLTIPVGTTLTAETWDGETGGVLAIDTDPDTGFVQVEGTISMTGRGFRGGRGFSTTTPANEDENMGEGIAGRPRNTYSRLRGVDFTSTTYHARINQLAYGNAGGCGQNDAGGGGGSNGRGFGGKGGDSGFNPTHGTDSGFGARALPSVSTTRIFLGGGGGSGGADNEVDQIEVHSGQAGGGIAIMRTVDISGAGSILVNGDHTQAVCAVDCIQNFEGAGGGGAAGTVAIFALNDISGTFTIQANGGYGGVVYLIAAGQIADTVVDNIQINSGQPGTSNTFVGTASGGGGIIQIEFIELCCRMEIRQQVTVCAQGTFAPACTGCDSH